MAKQSVIELGGTVLDTLPNVMFKIELESGHEILTHVNSKIGVNYIHILPGDKVTVKMSPYDLSRDRVTYRYR